MGLAELYERLQSELLLHGAQYKLYIEAATVAVLFYVALTDFLTFKIRNELIVLLLILYALFAFVTRSRIEVLTDIVLAVVIFAVLLWFYSQGEPPKTARSASIRARGFNCRELETSQSRCERPFSGVKRTSNGRASMSAFDPKRTSAYLFCRDAVHGCRMVMAKGRQ